MDFWFLYNPQCRFFYKEKLSNEIGFYDTRYKYSADYDLFYKMIVKKNVWDPKKNEIFGKFRQGGLSSRIKYLDFLKENNKLELTMGKIFYLFI